MIRAAVKGEAAKIDWPYGPTEVLYGKDAAKGTVLAVLQDKFKDQLFHIGNGQLVGGAGVLLIIGASMLLLSRRRRTADR